ncbi:MAG: 1,2-phenylacetyl-CoA epoxidase subunit PaaD [Cardiobacteriaceae bacterium]|nr:1,2-phenylacetyl-CoA epoxidase subunit PaaD [Cardiobacteriaceae bacterium]
MNTLDLAAIRAVLAQVPDPEVPVLTLDDLGIIRDVAIDGNDIVVTLTPTYMGCPATLAIRKMVSDALVDAGYPKPVLKEQLSPAWTTDWISAEAKAKLRAYGIAPPAGDTPKDCPLCASTNTQLVSRFGSTACKALYRCGDCGEPFEYFKCH